MGIVLSQAEKDDIRIIPTENMLAFMAYCRGLDYEDRGMLRESAEEYKKATGLDPNFRQAERGVDRVEKLSAAELSIPSLEGIFLAETGAAGTAAAAQEAPASTDQTQTMDETQTAAESETEGEKEIRPAAEGPVAAPAPSALVDQMMHTADVLDRGFLPGVDAREPAQEQSKPGIGNTANIEIRVDLPEPPNVR